MSYLTIREKLKKECPELDNDKLLTLSISLDEFFKEQYKDIPFLKGGQAFFDSLHYRMANHWHGNPIINAECQKDNKIVAEFAENALDDFDQYLGVEWKMLSELFTRKPLPKTEHI